MKLPNSKIEKAAAIGLNRPFLEGVYVDTESECAFASDGFIAARVPIELSEGDDGGLVDLSNVKAIRKARNRDILPCEIDESAKFPVGYIQEQLLDIPTEAPIIVLDAAKLYNLAQAICEPSRTKHLFVGLYLPKKHGPIIVKALDPYSGDRGTGGTGLIIEVRNNMSYNLRLALDELRQVLVDGDPVDSKLRAQLRHALVEG